MEKPATYLQSTFTKYWHVSLDSNHKTKKNKNNNKIWLFFEFWDHVWSLHILHRYYRLQRHKPLVCLLTHVTERGLKSGSASFEKSWNLTNLFSCYHSFVSFNSFCQNDCKSDSSLKSCSFHPQSTTHAHIQTKTRHFCFQFLNSNVVKCGAVRSSYQSYL